MHSVYDTCAFDPHERQIRCLTVFKGHFDSRVRGRLEAHSFSGREKPKYAAISYTWGDRNDKSPIYVNGMKLWVTKNAYSALRYLRKEEEDIVVWLDAICIDQGNDQERNEQVSMMDEIYASSVEVMIWLGKENSRTSSAFAWLHEFSKHVEDPEWLKAAYADSERTDKRWEAVEEILERPYWERVWILQECASRVPRIVYMGHQKLAWEKLVELNILWDGSGPIPPTPSAAEEVARSLPVPITMKRTSSGIFRPLTFLRLLAMSRYQKCTIPHDRIYGVLNVFSSEHRFHLPVRYDRPVEEVYKDTAVAIIKHSRSLDIFAYSEPGGTARSLPSWAPDWHTARTQSSIIPVHSTDVYAASRHESAFFEFSQEKDTVTVKGIVIDTVSLALPPYHVEDYFLMKEQNYEELLSVVDSWQNAILEEQPDELVQTKLRVFSTLHRVDKPGDPPMFKEAELWTQPSINLVFVNTYNRALVTTKDRQLMVVAPEQTQKGDVVCIIYGCQVPIILRPHGASDEFQVVGEAFVQGLMHGQGLDLGIETCKLKIT